MPNILFVKVAMCPFETSRSVRSRRPKAVRPANLNSCVKVVVFSRHRSCRSSADRRVCRREGPRAAQLTASDSRRSAMAACCVDVACVYRFARGNGDRARDRLGENAFGRRERRRRRRPPTDRPTNAGGDARARTGRRCFCYLLLLALLRLLLTSLAVPELFCCTRHPPGCCSVTPLRDDEETMTQISYYPAPQLSYSPPYQLPISTYRAGLEPETVSYSKRVPNCQKCGQHGRKSRLKGHKRSCPFRDCNCPKCQVVSERQKLMADQIKIRRRQRKDSMMNLTRERLAQTINAVNAISNATTAGTLPYLSSINMIYKQLSQVQPQVSSAAAFIASPSPASTTADTPSFSYPFNPTPPDMLKMAATPTALPQLPLLFSTPQTASAPTVTSVPASSPELQQQQLILPGSTPSPMSPVSPTVTVSSLLDSIAAPIAIHPSLQTQSQNEQLLSFLTQMRLLDPKLCMPASAFDLLQAVTSAAAPLSDVAEPVSTAPSAFVDVCTV
uniref:DM domain-containing protein n=1 Tax=Steinernema glaseri TaxID=37863 RepID=A0A1I7ZZ63_9BILA